MDNVIESKAQCRNLRGSARKARLVLDMIRGKKVSEAKNILEFSTKKMSVDILRLLNSAIANAVEKSGKIDTNNMVISRAWADGGTMMKRMMPRANGNAFMILKRHCHITIGITNNK
jgi:large subunit ribosomal protein L22